MSILVKPYSGFTGVYHYTKHETEHVKWFEKFKEYSRPLKNVNLVDIESRSNKQTDVFELPIQDITEKHIRNFRYVQRRVDYAEQELHIEPYNFGLWLGDGHANACALTTIDLPVANIWCDYLKRIGLNIHASMKKDRITECKMDESDQVITYYGTTAFRSGSGNAIPNTNPFKNGLRRLKVFNAKHIPDVYLKNSKENRLKLLAGLIDTDGTLASRTSYSITQKRETLSNNIVELCESLGFFATITPQTKRCTNSKNPNHEDTYYRVDISITFHTPTIPLQIERKRNVKPEPGQVSNFQSFDINGNPLKKIKQNVWTDEKKQKLYNVVEIFKQYEPGQIIPWTHIQTMDTEFNVFTSDALRKQYTTIIKENEHANYSKNTLVLKHEDFIDNEWFEKYKKALKLLEEQSNLSIYTDEGTWYYRQRVFFDTMYIIKKQLLDNIQENLPKSNRTLLVDHLKIIKKRYHDGERIENISLINDRLYVPSGTKYNDIGTTIQSLQSAIKRGELWNGYEPTENIEMYKPLLHEVHLDPNKDYSGSLIYKLLKENNEMVEFYTSASDAAKSMIKDGQISSYKNGKRKISKASNIQGVEYGYKWVNCSIPGVYKFETASNHTPDPIKYPKKKRPLKGGVRQRGNKWVARVRGKQIEKFDTEEEACKYLREYIRALP